MPRKKITLEDAFAVFEQHGLKVKVEAVTPPNEPVQAKKAFSDMYGPTSLDVPTKVGNSTVKVVLYARHTVGSGGVYTGANEEKKIENAGVESYGPGPCYVPAALAASLLHQDGLAKQADARMLDTQSRCYIIAPRIGSDGQRANVGIRVDDMNNIGNLPNGMFHIV